MGFGLWADRPMFYVLDNDNRPVPVRDSIAWARWKQRNRHRCIVGRDAWAMDDGTTVRVSTVFLGHDHNFGIGGGPILYETMVFLDPAPAGYDPPMWRYETADEAAAGHAKVVAEMRRLGRPERGVPLRLKAGDPVVDGASVPRRHEAGFTPDQN